jgi:hypothetical protein
MINVRTHYFQDATVITGLCPNGEYGAYREQPMAFLITADRPSDIIDFLRGSRFDQHVIDYRRETWLADKAEEFALRRAAVAAGAAEIITRAKAARRPTLLLAAE